METVQSRLPPFARMQTSQSTTAWNEGLRGGPGLVRMLARRCMVKPGLVRRDDMLPILSTWGGWNAKTCLPGGRTILGP